MIRSESITTLLAALLKARASFDPVLKNAANPHLKSKYANLNSVIDAVDKPLADNGLIIVQASTSTDSVVEVETMLFHAESGEYIGCNVRLTPAKNDPQGVGSAITYARRYGMLSLLNLAAEDDDGHAATNGNGPLFNRQDALVRLLDMIGGRHDSAVSLLVSRGKLKAGQRISELADGDLRNLVGPQSAAFVKALSEAGEAVAS